MKYLAIIWNPVYDFCSEIESIISKYGKIINKLDLNLNDNNFKDFIVSLYNYKKEEKWKTDYKINDLIIYNNKTIRVLEIEIEDNEYITNSKNKTVLKKAQELKDYIRDNYDFTLINGTRKKIYRENAFHLTDNLEEYRYQKSIVKKFFYFKFINNLESAKYYDALPRFSKNVYDYLKSIGVNKSLIADVGSGTGRIAIDLLDEGNTVYAIDPDNNMRSICEKKCNGFNNFISIDGNDINMNIKDKSVDYVIVSQSFHRFSNDLFKKECNRVLKNPNNIIIIYYRVDFNNDIYSEMLDAIKTNYLDYQIRYDTDEIKGAKKEERENNKDIKNFFNGKSHMKSIKSEVFLSLEEFLTLGLSLSLFPIVHKLNNTSEVLKQKSFKKNKYINSLKKIFSKYSNDNKIKLIFKVQIHSIN